MLTDWLVPAAQILIPMLAAQLLYRLIDRRGSFAKRLLPTTARRVVWLTVGFALMVLILGAAAFLLRTGVGLYYIICGAAAGLMIGIAAASMDE